MKINLFNLGTAVIILQLASQSRTGGWWVCWDIQIGPGRCWPWRVLWRCEGMRMSWPWRGSKGAVAPGRSRPARPRASLLPNTPVPFSQAAGAAPKRPLDLDWVDCTPDPREPRSAVARPALVLSYWPYGRALAWRLALAIGLWLWLQLWGMRRGMRSSEAITITLRAVRD